MNDMSVERQTMRSPLRDVSISGVPRLTELSMKRVKGLLIGIALGDSLGLPLETMTHRQIVERFGVVRDFLDPSLNSFLSNERDVPLGSYSDDAQLTMAIFDALERAGDFSIQSVIEAHVAAYEDSTMGWGGSTMRGVEALRDGLRPEQAEFKARLGHGTGNGIPMKIAALAAWCVAIDRDPLTLGEEVAAICAISHPNSTSVSAGLAHLTGLYYCLTHSRETFSKGEFLRLVVAASRHGERYFPETLNSSETLASKIEKIEEVAKQGTIAIIEAFGGGGCLVSDSLPFSYAFFLRDPFGAETLYQVIEAGGDTDSNGAFVGALQGALLGESLFDAALVERIHKIHKVRDSALGFYRRFSAASATS